MKVKLLRKVKKHILEEPKRLFMAWYVVRKGDDASVIRGMRDDRFADCGTAACIAGWTLILSGEDTPYSRSAAAAKLLGIDHNLAANLFEPSLWPAKFMDGLADDGDAYTAKVCAARIEHFIKTKGAE
jgi:hypothetical protein